ncbi:MAG: hypothetical protein NZ872_01950 [Archaeoglobaceae archaeon]|nr:hypothetical protein [Archaeoglobaceae archaeon]MDW8127961.1 hypothetical protein [Archaeoglobaceae archaeon]
MKMLRLEFDLQHHLVLSRKNPFEHALIRLILSTLATSMEIMNFKKKDMKRKGNSLLIQFHGEKKRISPLDKETHELINSVEGEKPFQLSEQEIDEIVSKYSPRDKKYNAKSLRNAMFLFLKDSSLFEVKLEELSQEELLDFMLDFNPLYSGSWLDEEGLREFVLNYSALSKITDPKRISEETGIEESFVSSTLQSGKSIFLLAKKFDNERFIS